MSSIETYYWSRIPGKFVNKMTGDDPFKNLPIDVIRPKFTGTVCEWYETLVETTIDMRNLLGGTRECECIVEAGKDAFVFFATSILARLTENKDEYSIAGMTVKRTLENNLQILVKCNNRVGEIKLLDIEIL